MIEDSPTWAQFVQIINRTKPLGNFSTNADILQWLNNSLQPRLPPPERVSLLQGDPTSVIVIITICYLAIFFFGALNALTCVVIAKNKHMHTATNYYLFNLAISDAILLISGLPLELYNLWNPNAYPFNENICILQALVSETATNVTILTITSFSVERYIAICHPFRSHAMSTLSRAVKFIIGIWILGFVLALPQSSQFHLYIERGAQMCMLQKAVTYSHFFEISSFLFFIIPLLVISCLYIFIGNKLKNSAVLQNTGTENGHSVVAQRRVVRMLIAVVVAFFFCWFPFHCQRLMAVYGNARGAENNTLYMHIYIILNHISGVLYFLSTCINPILYNVMSNKFRAASKKTLQPCCWFGNGAVSDMQRTSSNRSHQYPLWRSEVKRISIRSTHIPFLKQASNSSIQTNITTTTPAESIVAMEQPHFINNNNKVVYVSLKRINSYRFVKNYLDDLVGASGYTQTQT